MVGRFAWSIHNIVCRGWEWVVNRIGPHLNCLYAYHFINLVGYEILYFAISNSTKMSFRIVMQRRNKTSLVESELLNLVLLKRLSHCILYQQFRDTSKKQTKTRLQPSLEFLFPHRLSCSIQSCLVKLYCWDNIFRRGKSNTKPRRLWARQSLLRSHTQKRYSQYLSQKKLHETAQEIETFGKQIEKMADPFQLVYYTSMRRGPKATAPRFLFPRTASNESLNTFAFNPFGCTCIGRKAPQPC